MAEKKKKKQTRDEYIKSHIKNENEEIAFHIVDESTVRRMIERGALNLPRKKVNVPKDMRWNTKWMNNELLAGIQNGETMGEIAKRIFPEIAAKSTTGLINRNMQAAMRNARTMVTEAENGGRLDSYKNLSSQGVVQEKVWIATPDSRTRESHLAIDGEARPVEEEFSNGLMFPADGNGEPAEVWNCRCSMRTHIIGFRRADGSISMVNYKRDRTMHNDQMDAERGRRGIKDTAQIADIKHEKEYNAVLRAFTQEAVKGFAVGMLKKSLSSNEIVQKLAGGDMTEGSCASLAMCYAANKNGIDVTDFRGGDSQWVVSQRINSMMMYTCADAKIVRHEVTREAKEVAKILQGIETDKEFIIHTGKHASVIRRTEKEGLQYLELQSATNSGWQPFEKERKYTFLGTEMTEKTTITDTLIQRFGCRKTPDKLRTGTVLQKELIIIDVDSVKPTQEFKDLLAYINTATGKQKKGISGGIK